MRQFNVKELSKNNPVILDGATGSNLMKAGLTVGECPEQWIYEHKEAMIALQEAYVEAGTQVLLAPTFTANRIKLAEYGLENRLEELNRSMVKICRQAAKEKAYVAADLTMTGKQLYPTGDYMFEDLVEVYKEQIAAILKEGVDLFFVETMMSLQECRAAVLAIKESCDLPILVSLTYNEDGRTLYGTKPETAVVVLQSMGVDAVGVNCSTGPYDMIPLLQEMKRVATVPIFAKPNAGLPELVQGETIYPMQPEEFAQAGIELIKAGAGLIGGCCGTTPEHVKALARQVKSMSVIPPLKEEPRIVTSERMSVSVELDGKFIVVGERINPTGKKALQEELKNGSLELVKEMARQQEADGASILDVNMGTNGIDEKQMMVEGIYEITSTVDTPLCIDTSYPEVMEAALRIYPGRALMNSISCEEEKMKELLPIAKKYGAMFVLLPLSSAGLPKDIEEKHSHIHHVLEQAKAIGISSQRAVVDVLVNTVGANPKAAKECFETLKYCREELKIPTICGLSNISFGMPQRTFVNTAFLNVAMSRGLNMAIANPGQEMLMCTAFATDLLLEKENAIQRYLDRSVNVATVISSTKAQDTLKGNTMQEEQIDPVKECVVKGKKGQIIQEIDNLLEKEIEPSVIIEEHLIPGINQVGKLYDEKKYFLPQLIAGANAMKEGMEYLEPMLLSDDKEQKETIVFATVEGDIHDIGKNLVVLMLKNYGYRVIDLGKDVTAETIVDCALNEKASIIGLSALMTTTMMKMEEVVQEAKKKECKAKIIIGGACITESFANEIGADGYSTDAADCVKLVERLLAM